MGRQRWTGCFGKERLDDIRIQGAPPVPGHSWVRRAAPLRPLAAPLSPALQLELHDGTTDSPQWQTETS